MSAYPKTTTQDPLSSLAPKVRLGLLELWISIPNLTQRACSHSQPFSTNFPLYGLCFDGSFTSLFSTNDERWPHASIEKRREVPPDSQLGNRELFAMKYRRFSHPIMNMKVEKAFFIGYRRLLDVFIAPFGFHNLSG